MNISKISMRNITRQKKRSFLLGGAIAFGIFIIITIGSFTTGMTETLKENFTSIMGGHIYILGTETLDSGRIVQVIGDTEDLDRAIVTVDDLVEEYHVRSQVRMGEIIFGSKSTTLQVSGIDWEKEQLLKDTLTIADGNLDNIETAGSLLIPQKVADKLGVLPGESVLIRMDTVTGQKNVGEFTVAAIIQEQDSFSFFSAGYTEMGYLNELIGLGPDEYQYLNLHLKDIEQMDMVSELLVTELEKTSLVDSGEDEDEDGEEDQRHGMMFGGGMTSSSDEPWEGTKFTITTLNDIMEPVLQLVNILNIVSLVLFVILMVITMVGLINTFRMVLIERTKEIGTMRAIGMHKGNVRSIFLLEALYLALFGAVGGIVLSFTTTIITGLIRFTSDSPLGLFLHNGRLQFITSPGSVISVVLMLAVMTLIAVYLPARKAAKLKVVDALRGAILKENKMKKMITIFLVLMVLGLSSISAISLSEANDILDTVDTSRNFTGTDFSAVMTMISEDPDTGIEKKKIQQFRRDDSDMFLMLFIEPAAEKGQGYLMIDENLWFYDPQSRKFNHTSMKESFGGTDAKNSDFGASSLGDDYKVLSVEEGKLGRFEVYIMNLEGTNSEVTYPTVKIWITKDTNLMLKSEDYSATGRLMRTSLFPSYAKVGDKFLATKMIFNDELIDGKKTQITITDISTKDLPDSIFTKSYVERVNR